MGKSLCRENAKGFFVRTAEIIVDKINKYIYNNSGLSQLLLEAIIINETVNKIREFNRFYMPAMDLLGNHYLGSEYSVPEARIFFEIYMNSGCNAAFIARTMNIDKSYLSRILKKHEKDGYIHKKISEKDSRAYELYLTEKGKNKAEDFIQKSNQQIYELIQQLTPNDCERLKDALDTVIGILNQCKGGEENR